MSHGIAVFFESSRGNFEGYAEQIRLKVEGQFADGVARDLTSNEFGTEFQVEDPMVVAVSADGVLNSRSLGATILSIQNGKFLTKVPAYVVSMRWDSDSSGHVDLVDFGRFVPCLGGPADETSSFRPSIACRDFFDRDGDGDVDFFDSAGFLSACSESHSDP